MKKSIFDLTYAEGMQLDREFRKTSYARQYYLSFAVIIVLLILVETLCAVLTESVDALFITLAIMVGFFFMACVISQFKRFDVIKKYYDEKK